MSFMEKKDWKPCSERSNSGATSQGVTTLLGKKKKSCQRRGIFFFISSIYFFTSGKIGIYILSSYPLISNAPSYTKKMKTTLTSSEKKYLKHFAKSYILLPTKYKKPLVKN